MRDPQRADRAPSHRPGQTHCRAAVTAALWAILLHACTGAPVAGGDTRVGRVLDGDSVVLTDGTEVRYLGINAPEAGEPFAEEARAANRRLVEGKHVELMFDRERRDRYGRLLAYVYVDGRFANAELVKGGLAHLLVFGPLREARALAAHQREARAARLGMWGAGGPPGPLKITSPRRRRLRERSAPGLRSITICNISDREIELAGFALETDLSRFRFPRARIRPGHVALVLTATGRDRLTGPGPLLLHWPGRARSASPPTALRLRSPTGKVIDRVRLATGPD